MATVAETIQRNHDAIMNRWAEKAQNAASARGLERPELTNILPRYLAGLGRGAAGEVRHYVESHLASRIRQGFDLSEIVEEFVLLEECIGAVWASMDARERPAEADRQAFAAEIQRTIVLVTRRFHEHMALDEQRDKRYVRLLQTIADEALRSPDAPLGAHLREVLEIFLDATGAHSISLVLFDPEDEEVIATASAGDADGELEAFASARDPATLVGKIAASDEPTRVADVETTELAVSDELRHSGIHSILGLRLPPGRKLVAILYVGLREKRPFTAREIGRLEMLGDTLTLHLDNAKLYADLRRRIAELGHERELREQFVAILAHDLREPLAAAKMSSQLLLGYPERLDDRRDIAVRLERNLDRIDKMIRDLLDVSRVRAGQRLPLRLDACDLGAVAQEVAEELRATQGERFEVVRVGTVRGVWSYEELRRAVWNLAMNAVKYGAPDTKVTIRVERSPEGARVSVHNEGAPIGPDDQARVFDLFARAERAGGGGNGWGLGLALVRACAEAHGGSVQVRSSPGAGTTFTLDLPLDSRPFQADVSPKRSGREPPQTTPRSTTPRDGSSSQSRASRRSGA